MTDAINWHPNGTPGPFHACRNGECPCGAIWDSTGEIHLATVFDETALGMDAFASDIGVSRAQRIINARMFIEAPAMVMALREDVQRYDAANPMRIAGSHRETCDCNRCRIDRKRAILSRIDGGAA